MVFFCIFYIGLFDYFNKSTFFLIVKDEIQIYKYDANSKAIRKGFAKQDVWAITKNTLQTETKEGFNIYLKTNSGNTFELLQESKVKFTEPKKIAILYISTGKYIRFWENFYNAANKNFLPRHEKTFFLFTDHDNIKVASNVVKIHQDQLPWPYITLKRYHFFDAIKDRLKEFDYIYFMNGDLLVSTPVHEEIFPTDEQEFVVTLHPRYFMWNIDLVPYERNPKSKAYIPYGFGKYYVQGAFNGGTAKGFIKLIETLKEWTDIDLANDVIPIWHDESMLNKYLMLKLDNGHFPLILSPAYIYPEKYGHGAGEFYPKQTIIDKENHGGIDYLRSMDETTIEK